ncbi:uncharacterized protein FOMMEDRAFT_151964 [Fomitiporia mediterranea MF3/22]|uniref:uncharacterized protein n=1 Tax=Fomitiporia mediterranea (strain MF3/22) TaxID=694068 RepID=UPI0004408E03|nr:uncharacterized protein FOMMEDRAFT_151964 [Fomitiporia mediterranea MF3/22]EJD06665.1 hypothetical protein FOMMEDRAFT_151964 [Fomitiporia mediterranea MF3/22]
MVSECDIIGLEVIALTERASRFTALPSPSLCAVPSPLAGQSDFALNARLRPTFSPPIFLLILHFTPIGSYFHLALSSICDICRSISTQEKLTHINSTCPSWTISSPPLRRCYDRTEALLRVEEEGKG